MTEYDKLKDELENLRIQVEDLEKQLSISSSNTNSDSDDNTGNSDDTGESGSTGSSSDDEWVTVYDMNSTDETINLGLTSGICGSYGTVSGVPDLTEYNAMRIRFHADDTVNYYYFDISLKDVNFGMRMVVTNTTSTALVGASAHLVTNTDSIGFFVGNFTMTEFFSKKYCSITDLKSTPKYYYISKVDVRKRGL